MTKYFLMFMMAFVILSCSKKVEVKGNLAGGSPLERIEFIEASGVATLPLTNIGVDSKGSFSGSFEAPKNGMYIMTYAGKQAMIYLKGGQTLDISGQAANFPNQFTITGDAKKNNDFLKDVQTFIDGYAAKINIREMITKNEPAFLKDAEKLKTDIEKGVDNAAKKNSPDSEVVQYKKDELNAMILGVMNQYEINHPQAIQNPNFKVSKNFTDAAAKLEKDSDRMLKNQPIYRNYLLGKISPEFQKYAQANAKPGVEMTTSEMFSKFLDTKKDMNQLTKDYLLAYVLSNGDISPNATPETNKKLAAIIQDKIKDGAIKKDLERIQLVLSGPKVGDTPSSGKLIKQDGKNFQWSDAKGKPQLVMFYASWNPYISEAVVPVVKEVANFYKSKMDFTYVNLDDTQDQFNKTSKALFNGAVGNNVYAEGGMNSQIAKDFGIYGFKMPSFVIIGKDGKIASKFFYNLGDPELVTTLDKLTGLTAPTVAPEAHLQNDLLAPQGGQGAPLEQQEVEGRTAPETATK